LDIRNADGLADVALAVGWQTLSWTTSKEKAQAVDVARWSKDMTVASPDRNDMFHNLRMLES